MKKLLIFISLLQISIVLFSQSDYTQTIRGSIVDKQSQTPLIGATIVLSNSDPIVGTTTDIDGKFRLEKIPIGRQGIVISYLGYNSVIVDNLMLNSGKEIILQIEMEELVFSTGEIIVKAKTDKTRANNKMATVSSRSFSIEETERFAGSLGDPSRMAANYAGVMSINDSRNDIIIRGNSPTGLLWRLDGVEIPNPNHFGAAGTTGGPVSMLNNNLLTNSDFFTSAFPAEFGNALSGVFDLKMRTGNNEKAEYVGQVGFNGFEFGAEGPFSKKSNSSYLINYRYSTLEVFNKLGIDMGVGVAIPQYQDLSFKIDIPGTKYGRFSIFGIGGLSYIELHDSEKEEGDNSSAYEMGGVDLDFGSDMGVVGFSHLYFLNEKTRIKTTLSVLGTQTTTKIDSLLFDDAGAILANSNYLFYHGITTENKYSLSARLSKKYNSKNNVAYGFVYDFYQINYLDSAYKYETDAFERNFDLEGNLQLLKAFYQWQHRFSDKLILNSGIHALYFDLNNEISVEPRLGLSWNYSNTSSVNVGFGLHSQIQNRLNYFLKTRLENGEYIETNNDLKLSKSSQFVVGFDKLFSENLRFKSEVYYQHLYNIPVNREYPEYSALNSGDDFYSPLLDSLLNKGTGTNYGIEFTFEKFLSNGYYFLITSSFFESKYEGFSGTEHNTAFNGNFVLNALGGYEFKVGKHNSITFDAKVIYAGGKPYIPVDIEASIESNYTEYDWDKAFEQSFDNYFRFDCRIGFKTNGKRMNQEWAVDLQNITDHKNIYRREFSGRTKSLITDYQTGFFPMMLWRIQF
ncbi:MAG: TonB-dependent receptor [Bacteroidetes bacterium]|jgi:hypothetical protein|nr:TonB-dependent receptor [Bacteroidota bacterium]MBT6686067.1 TonB-dependent receptor [Bacteroidota bacterium]MBT7144311.1 TonB-dependent receptor [Bacteroidota bacterium]MBT7490376.1 TonB-dependent receptor [Bacteroidota bacterium]